MTMKKRFADILYENAEFQKFGEKTVLCNSSEEFNEAVKDIECGLVSPGGTGLPRDDVFQLEKEGLIRVFRILDDDDHFKYTPSLFRFFYPSKAVYVCIPYDDVKQFKKEFQNEWNYKSSRKSKMSKM
jgi:hypothetical protein